MPQKLPPSSKLPLGLSDPLWRYGSADSEVTLNLLHNVPKHKRCDAGNSDMPQRTHKVLPLSKMVKVIDLRKISVCKISKIYGRNKSFICEIMKKEKEIYASFGVTP